jgi:ACS family tartrate transporter-like MFS transporter
VLTDRPAQARWLTEEERGWLAARLAPTGEAMVQGSSWALLRNPAFWALVIACCGASSAGSVLGVWQPQLLKSFGLSNFQTGLVNAVPYGIAALAMIAWGRHSDRTAERRWHTALPLLLIAVGAVGTFVAGGLLMTVVLLTCVLTGAYCFKGPFWSMASGWLTTGNAAAGIAGINAISNLIGGGLMVNVYGQIHSATDNYVLALLPLAGLTVISALAILYMGRRARTSG